MATLPAAVAAAAPCRAPPARESRWETLSPGRHCAFCQSGDDRAHCKQRQPIEATGTEGESECADRCLLARRIRRRPRRPWQRRPARTQQPTASEAGSRRLRCPRVGRGCGRAVGNASPLRCRRRLGEERIAAHGLESGAFVCRHGRSDHVESRHGLVGLPAVGFDRGPLRRPRHRSLGHVARVLGRRLAFDRTRAVARAHLVAARPARGRRRFGRARRAPSPAHALARRILSSMQRDASSRRAGSCSPPGRGAISVATGAVASS